MIFRAPKPEPRHNLATELLTTASYTLEFARECGKSAMRLAEELPLLNARADPDQTDRYYGPDDGGTLMQAIYVVLELNDLQAQDGIAMPQRARLMTMADEFRVSLPFNEAERDWVADQGIQAMYLYDGYGPDELNEFFDHDAPTPLVRLAGLNGTVLSAGRRLHVDGEDLIDRWARWRHRREEFATEPTVERTVGQLEALGEFLLKRSAPRC